MSFISNSQASNYVERTTNMGATSGTLLAHVRCANPTSRGAYIKIGLADGVNTPIYWWSNGSNFYNGHEQNYDANATINADATTWTVLVLRLNTSGQAQYSWIRNGDVSVTNVHTYAYGAQQTINAVSFGRNAENLYSTDDYAPNGAEVAYMRYWAGTVLSDAEVKAEITSATPVKAGCTANWALNSALTDSVNGYTLTAGGSYTLGSTLPSYVTGGGGGGSAATIAAYYQSLRANE